MSREEIMEEAEKHMYDWGVDVDRFDVPDIFIKGAEWMQKTMIDKLRELVRVYDLELDAEPRVYERDIQLCAKLSLIDKLIHDLED